MPYPTSGQILLHASHVVLIRHFEMADHVIVRHRYFRKFLHQPFYRILLVRLSPAQENVAHEHVTYHLFVHLHEERPSRQLRRQHHVPPPLAVSLGIIMRPPETHSHLLARIGPSPYFQIRLALEHHAVTHQTGQFYYSPGFIADTGHSPKKQAET